jgi:hypothetical protein
MKKIIQTVLMSLLISVSAVGISSMGASVVSAACSGNQIEVKRGDKKVCVESCGGVQTAILSCGGSKGAKKVENTGIWHILILVLNIMTGAVALAAVGGIAYAAILYATAEDKSDQVQRAKERIFSVIVGLVLFSAMFAILQYLIPGGIF